MITKYGAGGNFDDFLPHEMLLSLIRSNYNGSVELIYSEQSRTLRFSSGRLTAASSNFHAEQIDKIIERNISSTLNDDQREMVLQLVKEGNKYSQAVVEAGILSASELLKFSDDQARIISRNALSEEPQRYDLREEELSNYRPLHVDLVDIIFKSLINDVSDEIVADHLGADESTVFMASAEKKISSPEIMQNEELQTVLKHLDGNRTVADLRNKVGFNPLRTARALFFLKLIGWVEPAIRGRRDFIENPAEIAEVTTRAYAAQADQFADLSSHDGEEDGIADLNQRDDEVSIGLESSHSRNQSGIDDTIKGQNSFRDFLTPGSSPQRLSNAKPFYMNPLVWGISAVSLVLLTFLLGSFLPGNSQEQIAEPTNQEVLPPASEEGLSFYDETTDTEQLPLNPDFKKTRPENDSHLKVSSDELAEADEKPDTNGTKDNSDVENNGLRSAVEESTRNLEEKLEEKPAEVIPEQAVSDAPILSGDKGRIAESVKSPSIKQIQKKALERILTGDWTQASELWKSSLKGHHINDYTLRIYVARRGQDVGGIFERFANSAKLRNQFFAVEKENGSFVVCWGIFSSAENGLKALRDLPSRIAEYSPSLIKIQETLATDK